MKQSYLFFFLTTKEKEKTSRWCSLECRCFLDENDICIFFLSRNRPTRLVTRPRKDGNTCGARARERTCVSYTCTESERMDDDGEEEERSTRSLCLAFARGISSATYIKARYARRPMCLAYTRAHACTLVCKTRAINRCSRPQRF